jgi:hypothetical protein
VSTTTNATHYLALPINGWLSLIIERGRTAEMFISLSNKNTRNQSKNKGQQRVVQAYCVDAE